MPSSGMLQVKSLSSMLMMIIIVPMLNYFDFIIKIKYQELRLLKNIFVQEYISFALPFMFVRFFFFRKLYVKYLAKILIKFS